MSEPVLLIVALAVITVTLKAAGPVSVGARRPGDRVLGVTRLLAPALLAGLVVYETFGAPSGPGLTVDPRAAGLLAAAGALALRLPMIAVVAIAAVTAAALRAAGL